MVILINYTVERDCYQRIVRMALKLYSDGECKNEVFYVNYFSDALAYCVITP